MAERGLPDQPSPEEKGAGVEVFSSELRSFKMDRRSPEAIALRDAVSGKLLDFLEAYSDDALTEYIIVLVCNGKHQNQARDELEAFLGSESENFVAWLWNYLSLQTISSTTSVHCLDETTKSKGDFSDLSNNEENLSHANNIDDLESHKGWRPSEIASINVLAGRPQKRTHTVNSVVHTNNINQTQDGFTMFADASLISSTKIFSSGEQCLERQKQHWKIAKNSSSAFPCQPSYVPKSETVMWNSQAIGREDTNRESPSNRSAIPSEPSGIDADAIEAQITETRGNVWDRLGKPCKENESILRGGRHYLTRTEKLKPQTEEIQDLKHALLERCATFSGNNTERSTAFDKGHKRRTGSSQRHDLLEHNKQHSFEQVDKLQKTRHGDIAFSNMSASFSGNEESHLQTKEALQKTRGSVPNKCQYLPIRNELARVKNNTAKFLNPTCTLASSLSEQNKESDRIVQSVQKKKNTSETTVIQDSVPCSLTSDKPESLKFANGNSETKPIQTKITDVKLKLQKVENDMQKLRSKQAALIDSKSKLPSGLHNSTTEDFESRTVLVTNVHFAATREALFSHFTKCGPIVKVTLLTDLLTGHPKGEADIIFANKESVDKAILLSGTSFFSRILVVTPKSEIASGPAPTQLAAKVTQPRYALPHKGAFQAHHAYTHFQWKRAE